jgi:eukaryotic-like serine/threonine-protein kinase
LKEATVSTTEEIRALNAGMPFTLPAEGDIVTSLQTQTTYEIGRPFAAGGFGQVYECSDNWGHSLVAKVLQPIGTAPEMEERATSEVIAANIARSPHIVHVHDAFVYRGAYYIISERCSMSLRALISNGEITPSIWFRPLAKAVLHALHFMHTRGLVHGDVHSGNVLLHCKIDSLMPEEPGALDFKLGDFGQTRLIGFASPSSTWNDGCIPPEVLDPNTFGLIDQRADIYQAGLLFLRFLASQDIDFDKSEILAGAPREYAESLSHPAGKAIAGMLRRHVEYRPQSGLDAWLAIEALLHFN